MYIICCSGGETKTVDLEERRFNMFGETSPWTVSVVANPLRSKTLIALSERILSKPGARISVHWPVDDEWYPGVLERHHGEHVYTVAYDRTVSHYPR